MTHNAPILLFMALRIILACICGGFVGFERTKRLKEAGIRTHCIIAAGAALLMIISKYGFADLSEVTGSAYPGTKGVDAARIAAQVVSGISFLGAGVIFKNGNSVKGLTTAAGIWATAAVGLSIGAGMYVPGILGTVIVVAVQLIFHRYSIGNDAYSENDVHITVEDSPEFQTRFRELLDKKQIQIVTLRIDRQKDGTALYSAVLRTKYEFTSLDAISLFNSLPGVRSVSL